MKIHPAANAFPMMDAKRYEELKADIQAHGQRIPIMLCDGMILDGRNRHKACVDLGITPVYEIFAYTGNPWEYVWSLNGERRDISSAEQRYLIWKYCNKNNEEWQAQQQAIKDEANRKRSEAAKGNDNAAKDREKTVVDQSVQPLSKEAKDRVAKAAASKTNMGAVARGDALEAKRADLAEKVRTGELRPVEAVRQMKRDAVVEKVRELPADKYRVIYADPPWQYGDPRDGRTTGASDHYPTMSLADICALPVGALAADDAVLFLWTTSPMLEDAFKVIGAWGFKYKASFVWDKVKHNMGHYNSVRHEFLLVCTRGSCTPDNVKLFDSVQSIERTEHSRKPAQFREIIETLYTHGGRIELFARGAAAAGWAVWGNEA